MLRTLKLYNVIYHLDINEVGKNYRILKFDRITWLSNNESMKAGNYVTSDMLLHQVQFTYHISTEYHK